EGGGAEQRQVAPLQAERAVERVGERQRQKRRREVARRAVREREETVRQHVARHGDVQRPEPDRAEQLEVDDGDAAHPSDATCPIEHVAHWRRLAPSLPAALFLVAAFLAGGYYESTTALLAAAVWLGLAVAASLGAARRPSAAFVALAGLAVWSLSSAAWGPLGPALASTPLLVLYAGVLLAAEWLPRGPTLRALAWAIALVCLVALLGKPFVAGSRLSW